MTEDRLMSKLDGDNKGVSMHGQEDVDIDSAQLQNRRAASALARPGTRSTSGTPMSPRPPSVARAGSAAPRPHPRSGDNRFPGRAASSAQTHATTQGSRSPMTPLPPRPATVAAHHRPHSVMDDDHEDAALARHGRSYSFEAGAD